MNRRVALTVGVVVILLGGAVTWWSHGDAAHMVRPQPTSDSSSDAARSSSSTTTTPSPTSSATATPEPAALPVAACASTRPAGRIPATYWGMHVTSPIGSDFPRAPVRAVNLTTSSVYWKQVETAPGRYDFSRLDDIVATSHERHAQPMVLLGFTPSFHARQPQSRTAAATMPDQAAWRAWVTAVVERYGAQLDYQVWPEPNIVSNWAGTPEQMARLTAVAGQIIHDHSPDAVVVAPATALRLESQRQWMDRFWSTKVAGVPVGDRVDAVAVDPFPAENGTPEDALELLCSAQKILRDRGVDLPMWTNEINYGVPSRGALSATPYPDSQQAAVVARTYLLHAAMGIDRVYWLGWFGYPGLSVEMVRDGVTTPAGRSYSTVHDWLAGATRPSCSVDSGLYSCVVRRGSEQRLVLWRASGVSQVAAPEGARRLESLAGGERALGEGQLIRVSQSPVSIFE